MYYMLITASDDEEIVSESEDHIFKASELSSNDDESKNNFKDIIFVSKNKPIQYRIEIFCKPVNVS